MKRRRWLCGILCLVFVGCVERQLRIDSEPPQATVYLDGEKVGETPCKIAFSYYGTRELRLEKEGYDIVTQTVSILPPWYEYPVVDFASEVLYPAEVLDEHSFSFTLKPRSGNFNVDEALKRAQELRRDLKQEKAQ